jgi:hypothetical protein
LLKIARAAELGVGKRLEMLIYSRVNCAFLPFSALPGIRRSAFQQTAKACDTCDGWRRLPDTHLGRKSGLYCHRSKRQT